MNRTLFFLLFLFSLNLKGEEMQKEIKSELTLFVYYKKVLAHYPALKKQVFMTEESKETGKLAIASLRPRVQMNASYINSNDPVTVFGTLLKQNQFNQSNFDIGTLNKPDPVNNLGLGFSVEVPLFDARQSRYSMKMAESMGLSSAEREAFIRQQILFVSAETFMNAVLSHQISRMAKESLHKADKEMKQAEELKQRGIIFGADFYAAKSILSNMEVLLYQSEGEAKTAFSVMAVLMGEDPKLTRSLGLHYQDLTFLLPGLDTLTSKSLEARQDLKSLRALIEAGQLELEREQSGRLPRISIFTQAEADSERLNSAGTNYTGGVKGSVDLFDPGYRHRMEILRLKQKELESEAFSVKDQILKDLYTVYGEYESLSKNLQVLHQSLLDSDEALKLMEPLYNEGKKSKFPF